MTHGERPKYPLPTVEDHDDIKTRMDLTTKFNAIYDREWRMAYSELYDTLRWKDAECIYSLMRVVRVCVKCHLTHICLVDPSILIKWTSLLPVLGVSGVLFHFYFILIEIHVSKQ